ncbi:hypothetical protein BDZ94DRAFT_1282602 [Collybia nuda]|uniref:Uncharacterized protein n=1 Tax=Collybia nuda TaxID=64659 RepID=A0A9P5Y6L7_9AGAR|nr:hypothetical protein BDZ94DRAFT_1282602 [Collybia nuda]
MHTVSWSQYNENYVIPPAWQNLLHALKQDDLNEPETLFNLDKGVGITTLLEVITFDVPTMTVCCVFTDGSTEEWPLIEENCLRLIDAVARDVNEATLDREMEEDVQKEKEYVGNLPPVIARPSRHKRQRSLLMSLVAAIVPASLSSPTSRLSRTPPLTPVSPIVPRSSIPPRIRHRYSRHAIIDIYRQFALPELARRFPRGGYYTWVIKSMLRKMSSQMEQLVHRAGATPDLTINYSPEESEFFSITAASLPPTPPGSDDEDDEEDGPAGSEDTDTDGSSVHTPASSQSSVTRKVSFQDGYVRKRHHYVSNSPRRFLSNRQNEVYAELAVMTNRLNKLLIQEDARQRREDSDIRDHYCLLEVKARRKAWLNKALKGGIRGQSDIGMSMPFSRSPLSHKSWTSEEYEFAPEEPAFPLLEYDDYDRLEHKIKRTRRSPRPMLFPVCEEDSEDDKANDIRELELQFDGFGIDLEGGVVCEEDMEDGGGVQIAFEVEKPQPRPRARKHSMYRHRMYVPPPAEIVSTPPAQQLPPSSILYQPFSVKMSHEPVPDIEQPPVYAELDVSVTGLDAITYGLPGKYSDDEFTLGMDLPFSVRVQDRDVFANRKGLTVDDDHGWISPEHGSLHCR